MRINAISQNGYYAKSSVKQNRNSNPANVSFQGIKGGAKGGAIGAAAAIAFGAITGGIGYALIPLWTAVGAIGGHAIEEENKDPSENDKK